MVDTNRSERVGTPVPGTNPSTEAPTPATTTAGSADAGASSVFAAGDAAGTTGTRDTAVAAGAPWGARGGSAAADELGAPLRSRTRAGAAAGAAGAASPTTKRRPARQNAAATTRAQRRTTAETGSARSSPAKGPVKRASAKKAAPATSAGTKITAATASRSKGTLAVRAPVRASVRAVTTDPARDVATASTVTSVLEQFPVGVAPVPLPLYTPPPPVSQPPVSEAPVFPGGSGLRLLVARTIVVVVLLALGAIAGITTATHVAPTYTARSEVLMRVRDYAAVILGPGSVFGGPTPQRAVAAQVLAAQASSFTFEVARQTRLDPAVVAAALTVTASPEADVIIFSAASNDPAVAVAVANTAGRYEVSTYRDQLVLGLGTIAAGNTLDTARSAQLAQVQAFERISPSAQVIAAAGAASGGPVPASRGLLVGAAAGAVVAFLLLAADQALRSRRRNRRAGGLGSTTPS